MHKIICVSCVLLLVFSLMGCQETAYPFLKSVDEIASVEIVWAENSLEYSTQKTLSETEKRQFLDRLGTVKWTEYLGDPPGVYGNTIKVTYNDGTYEMICFFSAEYVEEGTAQFRWLRCKETQFNELIQHFLKE